MTNSVVPLLSVVVGFNSLLSKTRINNFSICYTTIGWTDPGLQVSYNPLEEYIMCLITSYSSL